MLERKKQKEKTSKEVMEKFYKITNQAAVQAAERIRQIQDVVSRTASSVSGALAQVDYSYKLFAKAMMQVDEQMRKVALVLSSPVVHTGLEEVSRAIEEANKYLESIKVEMLSPHLINTKIIQPCDRTYQSLLNYIAFLEKEVVKERREKEQLKRVIKMLEEGRRKLKGKYIA